MERMLARILVAVGLVACSACASTNMVGARGDASVDTGPLPPFSRADECGNGLDDDDNGRIDDGCPCGLGETHACFSGAIASRRVGTCTDGVQTCAVASGIEWGDWGDAPCVGGVAPAAEQCDGMDHDCDGARDEDCPCTAGATQGCGLDEFLTAPCMGGTQTCRIDGTWSACEGAVGPTPDRCLASGAGDGINQDCDETTDEGCGCIPEPEVCRDGRDNDCDGEIDEPACTPDWPPADAGVRSDAGADGGVPPACLGPGGGCVTALDEDRTLAVTAPVGPSGWAPRLASHGDGSAFAWTSGGVANLTVLAADATIAAETVIPVPTAELPTMHLAPGYAAIVSTPSGYVVGLRTLISTSTPPYTYQYHLAKYDPSGALIGVHSFPRYVVTYTTGVGSTPDPGSITGPLIAAVGGTVAVAGASDADGHQTSIRFYDEATTAVAAPTVELGIVGVVSSTVLGSRIVLGSWSDSRVEILMFEPGSASVTRSLLVPVTVRGPGSGSFDIMDVALAASCERVLACYRFFPEGVNRSVTSPHVHRCQMVSAEGIADAAFDLPASLRYSNNYMDVIDAVWTGTEFVVRVERSYRTTGYAGPTEMFFTLSPAGVPVERFAGPVTGSPISGSPQGNLVVTGDHCVVNVVQQPRGGVLDGTYELARRRACGTTCR